MTLVCKEQRGMKCDDMVELQNPQREDVANTTLNYLKNLTREIANPSFLPTVDVGFF